MTTTYETLAARCEAAVGADRELDAEIASLFGSVTWQQANYTMEQFPAIRWSAPHPYAGMAEPVYQYTSLIDAARTLVLEPQSFSLSHAGNCIAKVDILPDGPEFSGYAPTPALALCAAALRARAAGEVG